MTQVPCYTIINSPDLEVPNEMQLKQDLEKGDTNVKIETLKKVIKLLLNGERYPGLIMTIIRFVLPVQNHTIKKLLLIFWEIVPKTSADGKLLQEMILVCDAYRKDLQHPNEFLRGSTLRFLCKLKEPELLEPLMPAIRACLDHRHSYVRRNAVLAIFTIYKNFDWLVPDGPELIASFLDTQQDMSCKRNAFLMLLHADQERALNYLASCIDQVQSFGDILQLVIVELIYKVCHANPAERSRFIRCIYNLLNSSSNAVRYESAGTLITLSLAPTAIKAAAGCYIELIVKESDNNVKLIVLDRLIAMKENENMEKVMQDLVMDVLRVLAAPDIEVRRKTLALAMDLVYSRNINEMVHVLQKEVAKTHNVEHEDTGKYRQLLVRTLHTCSIKFPDVASNVIPVLVEFLSDTNELAAVDVLIFIREAIQKFPALRELIIKHLIEAFPQIKSSKIHRAAVWILGEYVESDVQILVVIAAIQQTLGEIPMVDAEQHRLAGDSTDEQQQQHQGTTSTSGEATNSTGATTTTTTSSSSSNKVTSDGTYATQSAYSLAPVAKKEKRPPLRQYLMDGDFFIGAALSATLTKLALRYVELQSDARTQNRLTTQVMLIMSSILHLGKSGYPSKPITYDDSDRIMVCLRTLSDRTPEAVAVFSHDCRTALGNMLDAQQEEDQRMQKEKQRATAKVQPDSPVLFAQLSNGRDNQLGENVFESSLNQALAGSKTAQLSDMSSPNNKLNKVTQLTGFSDPVYAEAYVNVNQYDIVLDVLIVNQTNDTLQNCTLELATLGDLKLVERPHPVVLAPHDFCNIKANVKVSSTENGIIFGNIVYDTALNTNVVVLNTIHIDIMDYIIPASCTDTEFRQMWQDFEWENKVTVNTNFTDLHEYLKHLLKSTNMKCLTPEKALSGQCGFMAANMYAKSIFGENALANLSIEKPVDDPDSKVTGHIRIRAKSQGMALSLGDKISSSQKQSVQAA
ncbi:coatomer subunit beta [Drosophila grimshawi]|uniref:Coatomer subunit beta n=1 Tax=Drosophila grimshawi TaxID=7222 RepID=B4JJ23_DROGR|nr:coatomer subunit beta [Drosophila grimshawi]XP_032593931.1 coatomer subunit beta [Drosophila grimshawi]EDV99575.1 GH12352 [Drosophila grimshawi]